MRLPGRWKIAKTLVRGLRYAALPELIGRRVDLHAPDRLASDLRRDLGDRLPDGWVWHAPSPARASGTLAKYRLLDVVLEVPPTALAPTRSGAAVLRELGFDQPGPATSEADDPLDRLEMDMEADLLDSVVRDIEDERAFVRIMLRDQGLASPDGAANLAGVLARHLAPDFWPHALAVGDACLTNARNVWAARHFYL